MTEIEKMKRAKMYLDKMSRGIDPITDSVIPDQDTLNNIRITRCLMYVSDILGEVIKNNGIIDKRNMVPFFISQEDLERFPFSSEPLLISQIVSRINFLKKKNYNMKQLSPNKITRYLLNEGLLEEFESLDGKKSKKPTDLGISMGITCELRNSMYGAYSALLYNEKMQHYIIDNMQNILSKTGLKQNE